jgi:hypothetical protein
MFMFQSRNIKIKIHFKIIKSGLSYDANIAPLLQQRTVRLYSAYFVSTTRSISKVMAHTH